MTMPIVPVSCLYCKRETPYLLIHPTNLYKYDLTGQTFERVTVNHYIEQRTHLSWWCCRCACGGHKDIEGKSLRYGTTRSCGCLWRESITTHGLAHHPLYSRWEGIKDRCLNPNAPAFKHYGGRGITLCRRWRHSFANFLEDMGMPEHLNMEIERKDNNGPYSPENCVWATHKQQTNNTRHNHLLTFQGETHNVTEWAQIAWVQALGISYGVLQSRIARQWDHARALCTPVQKRR